MGSDEVLLPYIDLCIKEQELAIERALKDPIHIEEAIAIANVASLSAGARNPSEAQKIRLSENVEKAKSLLHQHKPKENFPQTPLAL